MTCPEPSPPAVLPVRAPRALLLFAALLATVAGLTAPGAHGQGTPTVELPRGGHRLFPDHRVVAFAGSPGYPGLGELGVGPLSGALVRLERQARAYRPGGRRILPALDLITVIATRAAGRDRLYRSRRPPEIVNRLLRAARRARALLVLDIQPGRSSFLEEVRAYEPFLRQPEVGVALDPEWRMGPGQVPGRTLGSVGAGELNAVSAYLDGIVRRHALPPKLMLVHQFTQRMIRGRERIRQRPGVAVTLSVDGIGSRRAKEEAYRRLTRADDGLFDAFKLFYHEDGRVMTPPQVLALRPPPDVVIYE